MAALERVDRASTPGNNGSPLSRLKQAGSCCSRLGNSAGALKWQLAGGEDGNLFKKYEEVDGATRRDN